MQERLSSIFYADRLCLCGQLLELGIHSSFGIIALHGAGSALTGSLLSIIMFSHEIRAISDHIWGLLRILIVCILPYKGLESHRNDHI